MRLPCFLFTCTLVINTMLFAQQVDTARKPFVLGEVRQLFSVAMAEPRTLNIYLPEGYHDNDSTKYPVIYLLDGSADEDFIHVAGLVQFYNFSWINVLPKSIVVGIANVDRRRDYTFPSTVAKDVAANPTSGQSTRFMDFLETELQPYISHHYRTNQSNMIIGQSLGGLLATQILFERPQLFDQYLIVSPSMWWDNGSLLQKQRKPINSGTRVYVAVGEEGKVMKRGARAVYRLMKAELPATHVQFNFLKKENHATILHKAVMNAFEAWNK